MVKRCNSSINLTEHFFELEWSIFTLAWYTAISSQFPAPPLPKLLPFLIWLGRTSQISSNMIGQKFSNSSKIWFGKQVLLLHCLKIVVMGGNEIISHFLHNFVEASIGSRYCKRILKDTWWFERLSPLKLIVHFFKWG